MDLLQLEHFLAVVEEGTFTRAAERVCRTQPAVSQSIKKLEETIGTPLLSRDVHEVSLTEAGKLLADYARRIVQLRNEALRQVGQLKTLKAGTLAVAAHESAAVYLLPAALRGYLERFPDIKVGVYRSRLSEIPRQVMDREVDIGFVKDEPAFHEVYSTEVHLDQMVLVAAPRHPLVGRPNVTIQDLASEPFVLHSLCTTTAEMMHRVFEQHRIKLRVVAELWSFENIKGFVREGIGLAIVPGVTVRENLHDGSIARIPMRALEIPRRTLMIYREQGYLSGCASELIKLVRTFNWEGGTGGGVIVSFDVASKVAAAEHVHVEVFDDAKAYRDYWKRQRMVRRGIDPKQLTAGPPRPFDVETLPYVAEGESDHVEVPYRASVCGPQEFMIVARADVGGEPVTASVRMRPLHSLVKGPKGKRGAANPCRN